MGVNGPDRPETPAVASGPAPWPPVDLLGRIRRDPAHMAERAALFAVERLGEESSERLAAVRRSGPPPGEVLRTVVSRGVRTAVVDGSFVGGPFVALIPTAFCAALLAQGRMVLEIGEIAGRPATDPARAADLLVLQGAYPTAEEARRALDALPEPAAAHGPEEDRPEEDGPGAGRLSLREWAGVLRRMAYVLGIVAPGSGDAGGRAARLLRWTAVALVVALGLLLPFVWVPVLGVAYRSGTLRIAERATAYFGLTDADTAGTGRPRRGRVRPLALLVFLRTVAAMVLPFAVAVLMVVSGTEVVGHRWLAAAAGVVGVSLVSCVVWWFRQRRRQRRRTAAARGAGGPGAAPR